MVPNRETEAQTYDWASKPQTRFDPTALGLDAVDNPRAWNGLLTRGEKCNIRLMACPAQGPRAAKGG